MNRHSSFLLVCALAFFAGVAHADTTTSYTGSLKSPDNSTGTFDSDDSFITTLTLATASDVTLQTYGFGGGVNAAGTSHVSCGISGGDRSTRTVRGG